MSDPSSPGSELPPPTGRSGESRRSGGSKRQPMRPKAPRASQAPRQDRVPNYALRRIGVAAAAVAVVVVSIVVLTRAIGRDEGRSSTGDVDDAWSHVVVLTDSEISVVDPGSGEVVDTFTGGSSLLDDQSLVSGSMLVTMTDFGRITITDLTDGSVRRGQAGTDETLLRSPDHEDVALIGAGVGGDLTVIDLSERIVLSVAEVAGLDSPLMFADAARVNPSGTHLAVSDGRTFQTIVVDLAESSATPLAGQIVSINDELVVTAQRAGATTELEFHDLTGERLGSVDVPTPVATMLTEDGEVVTVDPTGVIRVADDGGVKEVGTVTDTERSEGDEVVVATPTAGVVAGNRTRLVVIDDRRTYVIDDRGEQLLDVADAPASPVTSSTRCLQAGGGFGSTSTYLDLDRVKVVGEFDGLVASLTSVDGCTAGMLGSGGLVDGEPTVRHDDDAGTGTLVWVGDELLEVTGDSVVAVSPDGAAVAVTSGPSTLLVDVGGGDPVELANELVVVHFAQR
ncbi:MAG: hypothetical protein AAFP84_09805 [Actinomycetota bacterium]